MRRTASAMLVRLVALIVAVLVAAPAAIAAPAPSGSSRGSDSLSMVRPRAASLTTKKSGTLEPRGQVRAKSFAGSKTKARGAGPLGKTRLSFERSSSTSKTPKVGTSPQIAAVPSIEDSAHLPIKSFALPGLSDGEVLPAIEPGDPYLAVGPDHVVETVNVAMKIQRRQGELTASNFQFPLADLFLLPGSTDNPGGPVTYNSDPRVIYDSLHGRWFASELSYDCVQSYGVSDPDPADWGHGYLDVAVSDTADPNGLWTIYSFGQNDFLFDYPGLGTTSDKVLISANVFPIASSNNLDVCTFASFATSIVVGLDWGQLQAGGDVQFQLLDNLDGLDATFAIRPSIQIPGTTTTSYAIAELPNGDVSVLRITGNPTSSSMAVSLENVSAGPADLDPFGTPPAPRQPGGTFPSTALDERPTDALYQAGRLVFVATTDCTPTGDSAIRDCVRVGEVNPTSVNSSQTQDFLLEANTFDRFFGGIGMSYNGTLHISFSESSGTQPISSRAVYQLRGDVANHVSPVEQLANGDSSYPGQRWGDYLGVAADPQAPGAVWSVTNYTSGGDWATNIWRLDTDAGSTYVPITPQRVLDTRNGTGLANPFHANISRTFQVTNGGTIPDNAVAITGNVTVTRQTAAGFVAITAQPTNNPATSTINFPVGDNRANNVTVPLGPGGKLSALYKAATGRTTHLVFDVTGYFLPGGAGAGYNTVTPTRILNTIAGVGMTGKLRAGIPRSFPVLGQLPVPIDAVAITGNLTVTRQTSGGYIALTLVSNSSPGTSTLNFPVHDNRANGVSMPIGPGGKIWAFYGGASPGNTTDLLFDVTGYYKASGSGLRFYPLNPGRIMNTLPGAVLTGLSGPFSGTGTPGAGTRPLDTAGHQGIPLETAGARAVTGNLTVTRATRLGFISIRKLAADPETSTLNFPPGDNRANGVTVPFDPATGNLVFRYNAAPGSTAHLLLDITGYFAP